MPRKYFTLAEIGEKVREARIKEGHTQGDASGLFGKSQSAISQAERGQPNMAGLLRIMAEHYLGTRYEKDEYWRVK